VIFLNGSLTGKLMILGRQKALLNNILDLPRYALATVGCDDYGHKSAS
jgi:hypothetical protein